MTMSLGIRMDLTWIKLRRPRCRCLFGVVITSRIAAKTEPSRRYCKVLLAVEERWLTTTTTRVYPQLESQTSEKSLSVRTDHPIVAVETAHKSTIDEGTNLKSPLQRPSYKMNYGTDLTHPIISQKD